MKYSSSAEDVAAYFHVSPASVRQWVRSGNIPPESYIRMPRRLRFDISVLEQHFTRHQQSDEVDCVTPVDNFDNNDIDTNNEGEVYE